MGRCSPFSALEPVFPSKRSVWGSLSKLTRSALSILSWRGSTWRLTQILRRLPGVSVKGMVLVNESAFDLNCMQSDGTCCRLNSAVNATQLLTPVWAGRHACRRTALMRCKAAVMVPGPTPNSMQDALQLMVAFNWQSHCGPVSSKLTSSAVSRPARCWGTMQTAFGCSGCYWLQGFGSLTQILACWPLSKGLDACRLPPVLPANLRAAVMLVIDGLGQLWPGCQCQLLLFPDVSSTIARRLADLVRPGPVINVPM